MKIRKFSWVLFVLILASNSFVLAQTKIPEQRYLKIKKNPYNKSFSDQMFGLYGGGTFIKFLNPNFSAQVNHKVISHKIGFFVGLYRSFGPLSVDIRYVANDLDVNMSDIYDVETSSESFASIIGGDIALSWDLLPAKKFFNFLIGGGYSFYQMSFSGKYPDDDLISETKHVLQPFWKSGLEVHLGEGFILRGEYQQALILQNIKYPYSRFSFGIAWRTRRL